MKTFVHTWDWKSQPNWADIFNSIQQIEGKPFFTKVETGSDEYAIIISNILITEEQAKIIYQNHYND